MSPDAGTLCQGRRPLRASWRRVPSDDGALRDFFRVVHGAPWLHLAAAHYTRLLAEPRPDGVDGPLQLDYLVVVTPLGRNQNRQSRAVKKSRFSHT